MKTQNQNIPVGVLTSSLQGQEIARSTRRWWWQVKRCLQCHEEVWVAKTKTDPRLPLVLCEACSARDPQQLELFPRTPSS